MAEYIERDKLLDDFELCNKQNPRWTPQRVKSLLVRANAADVVEVSELKEFAEDVIYQFGYHINYNGRLHLSSGGLSTLEWAFAILGWQDPKPYPEGECEWDGCHEYASCGTPTPDGYMRVCGKHYADIQARKEAEENARMDGDDHA